MLPCHVLQHTRSLPQGLGGLPLLRTIILEGNCLQQLPPDLFKAPRLHTLNVSHNQLAALPDTELLAAAELHYLDVRCVYLIVFECVWDGQH